MSDCAFVLVSSVHSSELIQSAADHLFALKQRNSLERKERIRIAISFSLTVLGFFCTHFGQ